MWMWYEAKTAVARLKKRTMSRPARAAAARRTEVVPIRRVEQEGRLEQPDGAARTPSCVGFGREQRMAQPSEE